MAPNTKSSAPVIQKAIAAHEAIVTARDFLETVLDGGSPRVEGVSPAPDAGWAVSFTVFVPNPSLGAETGGIKREVLDELNFVVALNSDGTIRDMSKS
ncbi:hypothetical protein GCM10011363_44950 [Marivita lacus]|uniref:Uncharacterized protein n=1 Tax=Marivita lacus TaxID=1323742 RepID=A0ABQ1LGR9_9RHOB|nr:hypothetical protein [Marivita lacus]GGC23487.1 hypothetical protein GCM10011363_44950 [Marivita lacus]